MATWKTVCEIAGALDDTEETTSYRKPSFKVRGKWFTGMSPHEPGALVVRVDPDERELLIGSEPELYYVTPHYAGWGTLMLVRLEKIGKRALRERIVDSYDLTVMQLATPRR